MKKISIICILSVALLFDAVSGNAQFWKKIVPFIVAPIPAATQQAVQKVMPGAPAAMINPVGTAMQIVGNAAGPAASQLTAYTRNAIHYGRWEDLKNSTNPWFIQTILAANILKQNGVINNQTDCNQLGNSIAFGVAAAYGVNTGDVENADVINNFIRNFSDATCQATFYQYADNTYGVSPNKTLDNGTVITGQPSYNYQAVANNPIVIAQIYDSMHNISLWLYSDGNAYAIFPGQPARLVGKTHIDPTGQLMYLYQQAMPPYWWYGIHWDGRIIGPNDNGQIANVGTLIPLSN